MKVSVIILTYNNSSHVLETIASVKNQSFKDWNCLIVDNDSADGTFQLVNELIQEDNRFLSFQKPNEGPSAARNFGFRNLSQLPEYVHFLDGDDVLHPEFLKTMVSYLDKNHQVGLLGCQFNIINAQGEFLGQGYRSRYAPGLMGFPKELPASTAKTPFQTFFSATGQGPFALFRASVFAKTSGYEMNFWSHEDSDIFCQMAMLSEVHYIPERLYDKRVHQSNLTFSPRANYSIFREKWDLYQSPDERINQTIELGLRYYYTRHKPFRDFKVCLKACKEFIQTKEAAKLKWAYTCFKSGLSDLLLNKQFRKIAKKRSLLSNSPISKS